MRREHRAFPQEPGKIQDPQEPAVHHRPDLAVVAGPEEPPVPGKLGPEHVAALVKGDIELPSDFDGVVYISLDKEDWQTKLGGELQEAGYEIDWNRVMRR